jgi:hypothetical protein
MNEINIILGLFIIGGQIFIAAYIIKFKAYHTKKGENEATKEDIEKITNIIKNVEYTHNHKLEKIKNELSKSTKLYERRLFVIEELHHKLIILHQKFSLMTRSMPLIVKEELDELQKKLIQDAGDSSNDFLDYFSSKEIYLPENIIELITKLRVRYYSGLYDYSNQIVKHFDGKERTEVMKQIREDINTTIPNLLKEIKIEFRNILGE